MFLDQDNHEVSLIYIGKGTRYKSRLGEFRTGITLDRVLGIAVNIPSKALYPPMCFLFLSLWSYRLGWVEISRVEGAEAQRRLIIEQ